MGGCASLWKEGHPIVWEQIGQNEYRFVFYEGAYTWEELSTSAKENGLVLLEKRYHSYEYEQAVAKKEVSNIATKDTDETTDGWLEYEMPPSKINYTGDIIMETQLGNGSKCYVSFDKGMEDDGEYYYSLLMQDFGWHLEGEEWRGNIYSRRTKRGCLYLNPKRQVAVYFYPKSAYDVFKVKVESAARPASLQGD